jgi:hypothetical protein
MCQVFICFLSCTKIHELLLRHFLFAHYPSNIFKNSKSSPQIFDSRQIYFLPKIYFVYFQL